MGSIPTSSEERSYVSMLRQLCNSCSTLCYFHRSYLVDFDEVVEFGAHPWTKKHVRFHFHGYSEWTCNLSCNQSQYFFLNSSSLRFNQIQHHLENSPGKNEHFNFIIKNVLEAVMQLVFYSSLIIFRL